MENFSTAYQLLLIAISQDKYAEIALFVKKK